MVNVQYPRSYNSFHKTEVFILRNEFLFYFYAAKNCVCIVLYKERSVKLKVLVVCKLLHNNIFIVYVILEDSCFILLPTLADI